MLGGSGCGAVGRVVTSDTRGPGIESSHQQLLLNIYLLLTVCRKDENKEKEAGNGQFFLKKKLLLRTFSTHLICCGVPVAQWLSFCTQTRWSQVLMKVLPLHLTGTGIHHYTELKQ